MASLQDVYLWIRFLHVFGVILFFLGHGASASVSFRLRTERDPERLRALLDLPAASYRALIIGFFWILVTGGVLGYLGGWWERVWFWLSIVLLFVVSGVMTPLVAIPYNKVRRALGLRMPYGARREPSGPAPKPSDVDGILQSTRPVAVAAIGLVGAGLILWLMMFKPF